MRLTRKRLVEKYAEEYERLRLQVELDLYPQVIEDWSEENMPKRIDPSIVEATQ